MVGQEFVAVAFNQPPQWFLGQVCEFCTDKQAKVKFLKRIGNCLFKWDKEVSETGAEFIIYHGVKVMSASVNSLRTWKISADELKEIDRRYKVFCDQYF